MFTHIKHELHYDVSQLFWKKVSKYVIFKKFYLSAIQYTKSRDNNTKRVLINIEAKYCKLCYFFLSKLKQTKDKQHFLITLNVNSPDIQIPVNGLHAKLRFVFYILYSFVLNHQSYLVWLLFDRKVISLTFLFIFISITHSLSPAPLILSLIS